MPKVSVLIPSYNHSRFLVKRLDSIYNQDFKDFEVIFLDDASTDDSVRVFREYCRGKNPREFINQTNSGSTYRQWNKGMSKARGEYIWLAESDDWADNSLLSKLLNMMEQSDNVGLAYCQSHLVDHNDKVLGSNLRWTDDLDAELWAGEFVMNGAEFSKNYLTHKNVINNASATLL